MKKLSLSVLFALSTAMTANAEEKKTDELLFTITGSYSPWFVTWEQTSTAATRFGQDAIQVDYAIDGAVAHMASLNIEVYGFDFDVELIEVPEGTEDKQNSLSEFNAGLNYTGLIGDTSLQYQFSSASFEGSIFGSTIDNDLSGSGTFETEAITHDVVIMTKWGLGFGYRSFSYDLPQDIYMVKESEPNTLLLKQFTNMEYQVDFYQIVFEKNALLKESLSNFNLGIKARYGLGTMDAFSQAAVQMEQELADLGRNVEGGLLGDGDVSFIEYEIFGYMPLVRSQSITADIKLGYRNKVLSAKFENSSAYKFVTDFETEFSGPYATLNFIW